MRFISAAKGVDRTRNQRNTIVGRKLTAACCDAGNSVAIRPEIGATISQNPMIKKPISTGPRTRLSTLSTRIGDDFLSIRFFKVTFFFDKFPALGPHYFTIRHHCDQTATFRRTKNVQDTRHRGRGQRLPAQIFPSLAEACRWLIINLKAIRHDDPAMNKKNIFSLARKKNIYYIYTIHYFYKPTLFIA